MDHKDPVTPAEREAFRRTARRVRRPDSNDPAGEFGPDAPLLDCGCPVAHVRDNGHQEGCTARQQDAAFDRWVRAGFALDHARDEFEAACQALYRANRPEAGQ